MDVYTDILDSDCHMFCVDDGYYLCVGLNHACASSMALWETKAREYLWACDWSNAGKLLTFDSMSSWLVSLIQNQTAFMLDIFVCFFLGFMITVVTILLVLFSRKDDERQISRVSFDWGCWILWFWF